MAAGECDAAGVVSEARNLEKISGALSFQESGVVGSNVVNHRIGALLQMRSARNGVRWTPFSDERPGASRDGRNLWDRVMGQVRSFLGNTGSWRAEARPTVFFDGADGGLKTHPTGLVMGRVRVCTQQCRQR